MQINSSKKDVEHQDYDILKASCAELEQELIKYQKINVSLY